MASVSGSRHLLCWLRLHDWEGEVVTRLVRERVVSITILCRRCGKVKERLLTELMEEEQRG